ncbi:MAG: TonB-dependent receptor [Alphaproteobacteria bacterium]|nr:TonB-dependent receptor [Alphaproteobacteria bacterium]
MSVFGRYSSLYYTPGANAGDLLFSGIDQTAYKRDEAYGVQAEGAYHLGDRHTLRGGVLFQADDIVNNTSSLVLPTAPGSATSANQNPLCIAPANTCQASDVPVTIIDNGTKHAWSYSLYIQDEWRILTTVTINYGLRYDQFRAFDAEDQLSPRANVVWKPTDTTTVHGGYARYFSPPPIENVATTDIALFDNTTTAADHTDTTPKAERADYYDLGVSQQVSEALSVGLDSFFNASHDLIDEGQFGAPIILTPFNYRTGRQYGIEFTSTYNVAGFSAYLNAAYERADGRDIVSSQFQFNPNDLAYIATHYIPLDHQQIVTASAGASYKWKDTTFSADMLFGTGLREDGVTPNGGHLPAYLQTNLGVTQAFSIAGSDGYTARFDVINVFGTKYEIRNGTGVGVGAPQFGPRRGFFIGFSKAL